MIERLDATVHLADPPYAAELAAELDRGFERHGDLFLAWGTQEAAWALDSWTEVYRLRFRSIGECASQLRSLGRAWWSHWPTSHFRRATLVLGHLARAREEPWPFPPEHVVRRPRGAFTLLDATTALATPRASRPWPHGRARFVEEHSGPPGRAYLKLWEAWSLLDRWPRPGERAIDLGAAPGGWTWALAALGARVLSVDKAPLADAVAAMPGVEAWEGSAFSDAWHARGPFDWLTSDVVCYPERLLTVLPAWEALAPRTVVTVKFQGPPDPGLVRTLQGRSTGLLLHLAHNKHELTWIRHPELNRSTGAS